MRKLFLTMVSVVFVGVLISSCSTTLIDFTVISTKNVPINKTNGVKTKGEKTFHYGIGYNVKDPINLALENAGPDYDLLVDGVITYSYLFFFLYSQNTLTVEGIALKSSDLKLSMGEEGYQKWMTENLVYEKGSEVEGKVNFTPPQ